MNSNFRNYYDNENYFNYVGSASYSKSFAWTCSESINLYKIEGIKKRKQIKIIIILNYIGMMMYYVLKYHSQKNYEYY